MKMEFKVIEKKKNLVEIEFDEKDIAIALVGVLSNNGVDAYTYEPHPLIRGFRAHIEADDAMGELKKAISGMGSDWTQFRKAFDAKLK